MEWIQEHIQQIQSQVEGEVRSKMQNETNLDAKLAIQTAMLNEWMPSFHLHLFGVGSGLTWLAGKDVVLSPLLRRQPHLTWLPRLSNWIAGIGVLYWGWQSGRDWIHHVALVEETLSQAYLGSTRAQLDHSLNEALQQLSPQQRVAYLEQWEAAGEEYGLKEDSTSVSLTRQQVYQPLPHLDDKMELEENFEVEDETLPSHPIPLEQLEKEEDTSSEPTEANASGEEEEEVGWTNAVEEWGTPLVMGSTLMTWIHTYTHQSIMGGAAKMGYTTRVGWVALLGVSMWGCAHLLLKDSRAAALDRVLASTQLLHLIRADSHSAP